MSKQAAAKSLLRSVRNRISLLTPASSTPHSAEFGCLGYSHSSGFHTSATSNGSALNASLKPSLSSSSGSRNQLAWRPCVVNSPSLCAKYSTGEVVEGGDAADASQTTAVEESESVDDTDATSRSTPDNIYWTPTSTIRPGGATSEGTARYASRFPSAGKNHFRTFHGNDTSESLLLSSIGVGTFLGTSQLRSGKIFESVIKYSLENGVNVIDTTSNNLDQYSERVIGHTIGQLIDSGLVSRDEVILCTKGGFIPREHWKTRNHSEEYLENAFISKGIFKKEDVAKEHCLAPTFLDYTLNASLKNFGTDCIDLYYLQNVETHIAAVSDKQLFFDRIKLAFEFLENACAQNKIRFYGFSTRTENLTETDSENYISLERLVDIAKSVGGDNHHFKVFQTPYNATSLDIMNKASQTVSGNQISTVDAAKELGLNIVSASSNYYIGLYKGVPETLGLDPTKFEGFSPAMLALQYSRGLSQATTALYSSRNFRNVRDFVKVVPFDV